MYSAVYDVRGNVAREREHLSRDIASATAFIEQSIGESISMRELAQAAHLSESRFKQKFKEQIGATPREYVNRMKVEISKDRLLAAGSVTEVAFELGFTSSNYFSVIFKRFTGLSPSEYIRRNKPGIARYRSAGQAHECVDRARVCGEDPGQSHR
ncbi:MAG: AraC family transcriptional regulator [Oscillospiraceae bacterium]|nr:AraC family transcriptional regulator [Oscillospiraceae bacterium]